MSLPGLLIYAGFYGLKTKRVFGYINTNVAKPIIKKYFRRVSILMLIGGCSTAIGDILTPIIRKSETPPMFLPAIFFIIGVIACFAMSGIMLKMEGQIKRATKSRALVKKRKK